MNKQKNNPMAIFNQHEQDTPKKKKLCTAKSDYFSRYILAHSKNIIFYKN